MRAGMSRFVLFSLILTAVWIMFFQAAAANDVAETVDTSEISRSEKQCEMSAEARDAINTATTSYIRRGSKNHAAWELIKEAKAAGKFPDCDSEQAEILAEKAKRLLQEDAYVSDRKASDCWDDLNDFMGKYSSGGNSPTDITVSPTAATMTLTCLFVATTGAATGSGKTAQRKLQQLRFIAVTRDNLSGDIANGGGEYLIAMAYLQGCPDGVHGRYAEVGQRQFAHIFPQAALHPAVILDNLETQIAKDSVLAGECKWIS